MNIGNWKITLINARLEDGFVIINKRIWVPASCTKDVILEVHSQKVKNVASLLRQPLNETGRIWCLELTQRGLTSFLIWLVTA